MSVDGEGVYEPNFLKRIGRKGDLIVRLNALHTSLNELSQDPNDLPKGLKSTAAQLVSTKVLCHSDKDVRLLSACCIVDILRIFAPEAPYCDEEMVRVFEVIISQIRSLSTYDIGSATGSKVVYILDSLSTVKSCVVPVIMAQTGVPGAEDLMTSLFDALISVFRPEHTEEVSNHMCSILQACIEECDDIDQDLLDILLTPLLPTAKIENPTAYQCVGNVLRRTAGCIQASVSAFINHVLVGTAVPGKGRSSELSDHIYLLTYELHKISPGLLLRVLPNICVQLQSDEEEIRMKAVKLLGKLFASQHADYGSEFHRNFKDFLVRFVDVSAAVRLDMVDSCAAIMKSKPQHRVVIEEFLMKRLRDEVVDVRLSALTRLIEVGTENPDNLTVATFKEIGKRVSDRKLEVRKLAVVGLSRMYWKHVSSVLPPLPSYCDKLNNKSMRERDNDKDRDLSTSPSLYMFENSLKKGILEKLGFVPGFVVNTWGYVEMRPLIMQLLQENVLPKTGAAPVVENDSDDSPPVPVPAPQSRSNASKRASLSSATADIKAREDLDGCRASSLLLLYALLTPQERASLGTILSHKAKVRSDLSNFLQARIQSISPSATTADQGALKRATKRLLLSFPPSDKKVNLLEKLLLVKDKTVFRLLLNSLSSADSIGDACAHRDDLRQRLDSKSPLGEYVACLYDAASHKVANKGSVTDILNYTVSSSSGDYGPEFQSVTSTLLTALAKHIPHAFKDSARLLEAWLRKCSDVSRETTTVVQGLMEKKDKKKGTSITSQAMIAAQSEMKNAIFTFGQCVSTIRFIVQAVGVLGSRGILGPNSSDDSSDSGEGSSAESVSLCSALVQLSGQQNSVDISVKLAEAATQLAVFSDKPSTTVSVSNATKNRKKSSSSSGSDSDMSVGAAVIAAIHDLSSDRKLSLSNMRLPYDMSVLSALVSVPITASVTIDAKQLFVSSPIFLAATAVREKVLDFLKGEVLVSGFEGDEEHLGVDPGPRPGGVSGYSTADAVCASLKLWTALVTVGAESSSDKEVEEKKNRAIGVRGKGREKGVNKEDDTESGDKGSDDEGEGEAEEEEDDVMPDDVRELVDALFDCIACDGASVCGLNIDGISSRSAVFEAAALCAVEAIRLRVVGRLLQVERWHRLGWAFISPNEGTRRRLLSALNSLIQTTAVHPRFLAYSCLLATDDSLAGAAEQGLMFAVRRLRSTHDALCGVAIEKNSDQLRALAEINMPETLLPYVLHLLSYHPDFPTSSSIEDEADKRRLKGIMRNLRLVIDTLLNSLKDDIGNLSFLLKQVNMISQHYQDSLDPENIGLNFVTILATKILSEKIKTVENVSAYPGDIRLPIELFQLRENTAKRGRNVREGLGNVDLAIENVLKKGRQAGGKNRILGRPVPRRIGSASPKKRSTASPKVSSALGKKDRMEEDDDDEEEERVKKSTARGRGKGKKNVRPPLPVEAPERVSSRLQRGTGKQSVSYEEKEESDNEVDGWEAAAAEISLSQSSREGRRKTADSVGERRDSVKVSKASSRGNDRSSGVREQPVDDDKMDVENEEQGEEEGEGEGEGGEGEVEDENTPSDAYAFLVPSKTTALKRGGGGGGGGVAALSSSAPPAQDSRRKTSQLTSLPRSDSEVESEEESHSPPVSSLDSREESPEEEKEEEESEESQSVRGRGKGRGRVITKQVPPPNLKSFKVLGSDAPPSRGSKRHSSPLRDIANVPMSSNDGHRGGKQQKLIDTNYFVQRDLAETSKGKGKDLESGSRSAPKKATGKAQGKAPISAPVPVPPLSKRPTLLRG